jgi:hypothetical protein
VLVDLQKKGSKERPDFYVMNCEDWDYFVHRQLHDHLERGTMKLDEDNEPYWPSGKGFYGTGIKSDQFRIIRSIGERFSKR